MDSSTSPPSERNAKRRRWCASDTSCTSCTVSMMMNLRLCRNDALSPGQTSMTIQRKLLKDCCDTVLQDYGLPFGIMEKVVKRCALCV